MASWPQSIMETFFASGRAGNEEPCEVVIHEGRIVVTYWDDGEVVVYEGHESGAGHFLLKATRAVRGTASLHRSPDGDLLEGSWREDRFYGMWRITLDDGSE